MPDTTRTRSSGVLFDGAVDVKHAAPRRSKAPSQPAAHEWDEYVENHPEGTVFHTQAWRDAVMKTFGHKPVYLSAQRSGKLQGVLPMFVVDSRFLGRVLVSVPYGVGGGILADDQDSAAALFDAAKRAAADRRCKGIDFRSRKAVIPDLPSRKEYVGFKRELPERVDEVLISLPRKARAAVRNARKKHKLSIAYGDKFLPTIWQMYARSMRRLGSLNYPYQFFQQLINATPGGHWISVVRWKGTPVAGLITLLYGDTVMPYFIGTTKRARACNAANFIYLCTMERAATRGYTYFDFGRTRSDNVGSFDFKRFQGFEPEPLEYQYYACPGHAPVSFAPTQSRYQVARRVWKHLPLAATRMIGSRLSYHFPG
ncbi:MAG: FemAB family XrtA/PEP-CTERM system-associated protein [Planctomycetota bacterium]|jgi:FemAB-related protein (PEP-CTERM system-associated)